MKKLDVPKFGTEAEEAKWWDDHMDLVGSNLLEAMRNGAIKHGIPPRALEKARAAATIRLSGDDLDRARRLSRRKKVEYRQFILGLIHKALDREEAAMKRAARRKSA
jgi:predicted DNA binding CopG/RHH family protein